MFEFQVIAWKVCKRPLRSVDEVITELMGIAGETQKVILMQEASQWKKLNGREHVSMVTVARHDSSCCILVPRKLKEEQELCRGEGKVR